MVRRMSDAEATPEKHRIIGVPWKPGQSGNPAGRPRGSRGKLSEDFLADLHEAWQQHGPDALVRCAEQRPDAFCKLIADLLPRNVSVDVAHTVDAAGFVEQFRHAVALLHNQPMPKTIEHANARRHGR
jgi:Family of unknown function (DUF5681)